MTRDRTAAPPPNLARIPAGNFLMGSPNQDADERPVHQVYISEFLIGRFPVTQDEYAAFVNATGHRAPSVRQLPLLAASRGDAAFAELAAAYNWQNRTPPQGRSVHPVVLVQYEDAVAYCAWLSSAWTRDVRLPTEAEWEKAARGGVEGRKYPWGDDEPDATRCSFLAKGSERVERGTRPTGTYPANGYGLYDVAGNVWEWVSDWYAPDYYGAGEIRDPNGPPTGWMRIVRGGSWATEDRGMLRCACRHTVPPDTYAYSIGFRIVCTA